MKMNLQVVSLRQLAQLDVDAIRLYDSALAHIDVPAVREQLSSFRVDHVRHVQDLNRHIEQLGGVPVEMTPDLKGRLLNGFTAATSRFGTRAALMAMVGNEELTTGVYSLARSMKWENEEIRALVERHHADEQRHLRWILAHVRNPAQATASADETQASGQAMGSQAEGQPHA